MKNDKPSDIEYLRAHARELKAGEPQTFEQFLRDLETLFEITPRLANYGYLDPTTPFHVRRAALRLKEDIEPLVNDIRRACQGVTIERWKRTRAAANKIIADALKPTSG